jgi:membrane protein
MKIFHNLGYLILAVFQVIWMFLRHLVRRSHRFFKFFGYLNWTTLQEVGNRAGKQRLLGLSAEMAYNAMLALFPALLALISAIGLFQSLQLTLYQMARLLGEIVPNEVRSLIRGLIEEIVQTRNQEIFSVSFIGAIWAFSGVLSAAIAALDQIHQIPAAETRPFWQAKLVSIGLTIGTIMLLILACGVVFVSDLLVQVVARQSCLLDAISNCQLQNVYNCRLVQVPNCPLESNLLAVWDLWRWPITLGIVSIAFAFIYRYGPSRHRQGMPIFPGAILAAIFWAGFSGLLRFYLSNFANYNWTYGTIGTFIVLLLWLNFSSLVMLLGAQLNVIVGKEMKG